MTRFLRSLHKDICFEFGESHMGTYTEMHPLAKRMLKECYDDESNRTKYEEFIGIAMDSGIMRDYGMSEDKIRDAITPKIFYRYMRSIAIGMQFAVKKLGGIIKADNYEFHQAVIVGGKKYYDSLSAIGCQEGTHQYTLIINPVYAISDLLQGSVPQKNGAGRHDGELYTPFDRAVISIAEEILHLYQAQSDKLPRYIVEDDFCANMRNLCREATDLFKEIAARELSLAHHALGFEA